MEHADELRTLHRYQCFAALLGEHGVYQVQINASCKECGPAIYAVVFWIMVLAEPC